MLVYTSIKLVNGGRSPPYGNRTWIWWGDKGRFVSMRPNS